MRLECFGAHEFICRTVYMVRNPRATCSLGFSLIKAVLLSIRLIYKHPISHIQYKRHGALFPGFSTVSPGLFKPWRVCWIRSDSPQYEREFSPGLLHLFDGNPSFRRDAHNLSGNAQSLVGVKESHSRNWVIHFAYDGITLFAQLADHPVEIANRQSKSNVLCAACGMLREVVMKHALPGNRLDEFYKGRPVIGLSGQPFASHKLAVIGRAQFLRAHTFRLGEASNAQGARKESNCGVNVRDYPADLCEFESRNGAGEIPQPLSRPEPLIFQARWLLRRAPHSNPFVAAGTVAG